MEELIRKAIVEQKKLWAEAHIPFTDEEVRLCVYENMRDNLKCIMSDVAYGQELAYNNSIKQLIKVSNDIIFKPMSKFKTLITTQYLENYGAHSENGKFEDGNAYWKFNDIWSLATCDTQYF